MLTIPANILIENSRQVGGTDSCKNMVDYIPLDEIIAFVKGR
jgi:hypothetical protein